MLTKLVLHKQIATPILVPTGETWVLRIRQADGTTAAIQLTAGSHDTTSTPLAAPLAAAKIGEHSATCFTAAGSADFELWVGKGLTAELSDNEQTLAALDAALAGRITSDVAAFTIAGRSITKLPTADLTRLRSRYASLVAKERTSLSTLSKTTTRFPLIRFTFGD